jgi:hypothetical protein
MLQEPERIGWQNVFPDPSALVLRLDWPASKNTAVAAVLGVAINKRHITGATQQTMLFIAIYLFTMSRNPA